MKRIFSLMTIMTVLLSFSARADVSAPKITHLNDLYSKISDNGKWTVFEKGSETDGSIEPAGGTLLNLETMTTTDLTPASGIAGVADVTDDGATVVGMHRQMPAVWTAAGGWKELTLPKGFCAGYLCSVTPDGKKAAGYVIPDGDVYKNSPVVYDLETGSVIEMPNLPKLDMQHENMRQMRATDISADGRYVLCIMSFSYVGPPQTCSFVYDLEKSSYKMLGFTENDTKPWTPLVNNLYFLESPVMSPNGRWVTGVAYMVEPVAGSEFGNEYMAAFRYNVETDEFEVFNGTGDNDHEGFMILNDGTLITGTPASNPYRFANVRYGNYYIPFDEIFSQAYGINFEAQTGYVNTGTPYSASADGLTMLLGANREKTYVLRLNEPITEGAKKVNLLASYAVNPPAGSVMTRLTSFTLSFDREVEINGSASAIKCLKEDGTDTGWAPLSSNGWVANGRQVTLTYRGRQLEDGVKYTITIPAGRIRIKGDNTMTSPEIKISFTGRADKPVAVTKITPESGSSVAGIDLTSNPVLLTFDANLKLADGAKAGLWREGETEAYCDLTVLASNNQLLLYPLSAQHLYEGTDYKIVIPAGTVTDISGAGANEEITISYKGSYVRQASSDDRYIFQSTCDNPDDFMLYDGDRLQPNSEMAAIGFNKDLPWSLIRDSETSSDMALGAHSMFANGGTADDWMVTPQSFIPDKDCYLTFDAQSYRKSATDRLKVYVYASQNVYNSLNKTIVDDIRANGKLVFDERLSPGENEETMAGEWTPCTVSLADYAGKEIYVAFVNDNTDGSMVFVDNVFIIHDLRFLTTFLHNDRVVGQESAEIKGNITIASEIDTYSKIELVLKDGDGKELDRISESGLSLSKGKVYTFAFSNGLPLTVGEASPYTVEVTLDDYTSVVPGTIRCLSFEPAKHIVVEEYSGRECSNCPKGFAAMENLEHLYGDAVIPIVLRTYQSDPLGTGMGSYTSFLGFSAAPSGRVNRSAITGPMEVKDNDYVLSGEGLIDSETGLEKTTWLDIARKEMSTPADAEITFSSAYDKTSKTVNVNAAVRSALNLTNIPVNIFGVIVEDKLETMQLNNCYAYENPIFGEWGKGGAYGQHLVANYLIDNVARATYGFTFNGTGGLVPSTMKAGESYTAQISIPMPESVKEPENCKVVLMLIDPATERVINANRCAVNGETSSVSEITGSGNAQAIILAGAKVMADGCELSAYAPDGMLLGAAHGSLDLNGYTGVVIVKAVAADGSAATARFMIR